MSRLILNGHILDTYVEMMDVTPGTPVPDPAWRYVDPAGHIHLWVKLANGSFTIPSTVVIVDQEGSDPDVDDEDYVPAITHRECAGCGARVEPGLMTVTSRQFAPGLTRAELDGEPISQEEARYFAETGRRLPQYERIQP